MTEQDNSELNTLPQAGVSKYSRFTDKGFFNNRTTEDADSTFNGPHSKINNDGNTRWEKVEYVQSDIGDSEDAPEATDNNGACE